MPIAAISLPVSFRWRLFDMNHLLSLIVLGIWRDQDDAKRGGRGEGHQRAMRAIVGLYTEWKLERLRFVIEPGKHGDLTWDISDW